MHLLREHLSGTLEAFHDDDKVLWNALIFQASHQNEAIRQGAVSLSSYYESLCNPSDAVSNVARARRHYANALSKAAAPSALEGIASTDEVLLLSLILHCVELFRHQFFSSYVHLNAALKIVDGMTLAEVAHSSVSGIIKRLSKRLEPHVDDLTIAKASSTQFTNIEDGWRRLMQIHAWICTTLSLSLNEAVEDISVLCQRFHLQLLEWKLDFEGFGRMKGTMVSPHESRKTIYVKILHGLLDLAVSTVAGEQAGRHAFHSTKANDRVRQVLEECVQFASVGNRDPSSPRTIRFGFDIEFILIVLHLASMTTDPTLRQKAVALLRSAHRQEGSWDSFHAAHIIECLDQVDFSDNVIIAKVAYFRNPYKSAAALESFEFSRPELTCCYLNNREHTKKAVVWFRCSCNRSKDCGSTTSTDKDSGSCVSDQPWMSTATPVYEQTEFTPSVVTQILSAASSMAGSGPAHLGSSMIFVKQENTIGLEVP